MFLISFDSAVHTAQTAHVQSVAPPSNAAHSTLSAQLANAVAPEPIQNPTCSAVQSSTASREIRPVQQNQTSSLPLGTYSFAALVDPSNTFREGKLNKTTKLINLQNMFRQKLLSSSVDRFTKR